MGKSKHKWQSLGDGKSKCTLCGAVREWYKGIASYRRLDGSLAVNCPPCIPPVSNSPTFPVEHRLKLEDKIEVTHSRWHKCPAGGECWCAFDAAKCLARAAEKETPPENKSNPNQLSLF